MSDSIIQDGRPRQKKATRKCRRLVNHHGCPKRFRLGADGRADGGSDRLGEALDVRVMFGFHHDAGELFCAGIAENNAAVFAEGSVGFGECASDFGERVEGGFGRHFHVEDGLRIVFEACDERVEAAFECNKRRDFDGGEKAVACRGVFQKNDVAGLFAAEDVAAFEHFFKDVAVTDIGAGKRDVLAAKNAFETKVGHRGGNDAIAGKFALGFEITRHGEKNAVAVDDFSVAGDEKGAVGVTVESDPESGALLGHTLLKSIQVKRATACVDIAAVWFRADGDDVTPKRKEEFRPKFIGGAVGAVQDDSEPLERGSRNGAAAEKVEVLVVERVVRVEIS